MFKPRFNTRFFLYLSLWTRSAALTKEETTHGIWVTASKVLPANLSGEIPLSLPPW